MIRWIRSLFAWRRRFPSNDRYEGNVWAYYENEITGQRRAVRQMEGHQPIAFSWLNGARTSWRVVGQYPRRPTVPPTPGRKIPPAPPRG